MLHKFLPNGQNMLRMYKAHNPVKSQPKSAAHVIKILVYKIPKVIQQVIAKRTLKDNVEVRTSSKEKTKVEVDEDGFKIPHATVYCSQKRLEADKCRKLVDTILKRDLDPSDYIVNVVKVSHELSPYGISDKEWRASLLGELGP